MSLDHVRQLREELATVTDPQRRDELRAHLAEIRVQAASEGRLYAGRLAALHCAHVDEQWRLQCLVQEQLEIERAALAALTETEPT